jgi:DNA-binding XRE family transcriptional regulator
MSNLGGLARAAVNKAVANGQLPPIQQQACKDCGAPARVHHHYLGYERQHCLSVEPLCHPCHWKRHPKQGIERQPLIHLDIARLKALRNRAAYSQRDLAQKAGVSERTIRDIERSAHEGVQPRTVRKLAEALGVEPHELVGTE